MVEEGTIRPDPSSPSRQYHPFVRRRMLEATDDELAEATRRARWIRAHLRDGAGKAKHLSDRSWRRWLKDYRDAQEAFGNGFIGLIPDTHKRGNRKPKIEEELYQRISKHIGTHYETPDAPTAYICWSLFREESIEQGLKHCDCDTYCKVISLRNIGTQTLLRKGARAARKYERWYQPSSGPSLPKNADRPWEKAHIDHTEIDLETPYGDSNEYSNRCWLTAMVDDCTGAVLAHVLSLNRSPNTISVLLVFRDCVRRHRRLPEAIVVDNGREFDSEAIEKLCSFLDIDKFSRPEGEPKYGALGERMFGSTNTHCLHNLRGNTKIMKEVRQVTKSFNPKNRATWTFGPLYKLLDKYFYQIDNNLVGPSGASPNDLLEELMAKYGAREHRLRPYDQLFLMMTSPTTKKGRAKVIAGRGVVINYFHYNCAALDDPSLYNKQVPVRFDHDDIGTAWVCVHSRWVECHSQYYAEFHGRSSQQIRIATLKIKEGRNLYNRARKTINASLLAQFFRETKDYEKLLQQEARDRAMQALRDDLAPPKDCYQGSWVPRINDSEAEHSQPGDDSKARTVKRKASNWPKRKEVVEAERARSMAVAV
jgi:putative transposase